MIGEQKAGLLLYTMELSTPTCGLDRGILAGGLVVRITFECCSDNYSFAWDGSSFLSTMLSVFSTARFTMVAEMV